MSVDSIARDRSSRRLGFRRENGPSGIRTRLVRAKLLQSWRLERRLLAAARQAHAGSSRIEPGNSLRWRDLACFGVIGWVLGTEFATGC